MNDRNPHQKPKPGSYDQNPHKKPNPNRNSIIIAVCITVAACAVIGVSLFFLISTLNKPNDTSKPTETTESTVQVSQASANEADTVASTAVPPSTSVPPSTGVIVDPPMTTVQPTTKVITNPPPTPEPTQDVAKSLFLRLAGWDLRYGIENGSQTISLSADQSFSMLYQHRVYENGQRIVEYFSKSGSFTDVTKINDFTYTMCIADTYDTSQAADTTTFSTGLPTKAVNDNFSGIYDGTQVTLYTPDAPLSQIPSEIAQDYGKTRVIPNGNVLGYYCLVNSIGTRYYAQAY